MAAKVGKTKRLKKSKKAGRPERVPTEKETANICNVIALAGTSDHEAYTLADIPRTTYYEWLAKGRYAKIHGPEDSPFLKFLNQISKARTNRTVELLGRMRTAAKDPKNWQAARSLLSITDPKRFVERVNVHVEEQLSDVITRLKTRLTPDEFERALSAVVESDDGEGAESDPVAEAGPDDPGDEAVQPPPPRRKAKGVPQP